MTGLDWNLRWTGILRAPHRERAWVCDSLKVQAVPGSKMAWHLVFGTSEGLCFRTLVVHRMGLGAGMEFFVDLSQPSHVNVGVDLGCCDA